MISAGYSELLNSLDSNAVTKLTIYNHTLQRIDFEREFLITNHDEDLKFYSDEMNNVLRDKTVNANRVFRELLITVTADKEDIEEAREYFNRVGSELKTYLAALGSKCTELDAEARLRILHNFYRKGDEEAFAFNIKEDMRRGHDFRDRICPDHIERHKDHLRLGDRYARAIYMKDFASYIKDDMIAELTSLNRTMMLSVDIIPVRTDEAIRLAQNKQLAVETNITNWQRRQNRNNNYSAEIPYDMELQRKEMKEFLDDLTSRDQRMMLAIVSMVITADTKEQLESDTEVIMSIARKNMCQAAVLKYQQMDGLNTTMPFGVCNLSAWRTLTTEALAVLMPFKVQEIMDKGGIYYGENAISHNLILCNKANLMNQSAMLLGVPGSGKSFSAKMLILFLLLSTQDDIIICDPEGEYAPLATVSPKNSSVIRIAAGGKDRLNPMYMEEG
ncbi:MAG: DUF87 domain-containing protein [Ruminococcaceae bacterium]|nr:DUF87 domain-containing protein [Oscillospiraceae bacterium]